MSEADGSGVPATSARRWFAVAFAGAACVSLFASVRFSPLLIALSLATVALWLDGQSWRRAWPDGRVRLQWAVAALFTGALVQGLLLLFGDGGGMADWFGVDSLPVLRGHREALILALVNSWFGNAIASELVFRGFLQRQLEDRGFRVVAVVAPAVLFGFGAAGVTPTGAAAVLGGIGLGLIYQGSRDLLVPILFRIGFDTTYIAIVALL